MSKESYYFKHDYNARADRKMIKVIMKHGMQGIGVYWCIIEMLYEEGGYLPNEYERITFELRTELKLVESVILEFDLFKLDADKFWSESVLDRLNERCEKSVKARESINKRWSKYERNTNVLQKNNEGNTKEKRREKKIKEENIIPPTLEMVKNYCKERNNNVYPEKWFNFYEAKGWMIGKNKMTNWHSAIHTWEKESKTIVPEFKSGSTR
jgi:hypothetical protein